MRYFRLFLGVCWLASACHFAQAQQSPSNVTMRPQRQHITDWSWINKPWTGDSSPYVRVTRRIDAAFTDRKQIETGTQKYRDAAKANPLDPVAQYAWGYACFVGRPTSVPVEGRDLSNVAMALSRPASPNTYEYARLRFIVTVRWRPYLQLKPLGIRLLKRNPEEYQVKRGLINLLVVGSKSERQQAVTYGQQLVRAYPNRAGSYASLGWAYDIMFNKQKEASTGDKAIADYRKFIVLSKSPIARQGAERSIRLIKQEQAQL